MLGKPLVAVLMALIQYPIQQTKTHLLVGRPIFPGTKSTHPSREAEVR